MAKKDITLKEAKDNIDSLIASPEVAVLPQRKFVTESLLKLKNNLSEHKIALLNNQISEKRSKRKGGKV
jgi:hypothetical protein